MKRISIAILIAFLVGLLCAPALAQDRKKITELNAATELTVDDLFVIVDDPGGGTPTTKKITVANAFKIPISSDANGMTGAEMTTAGMYGTLFIATGAGTWTLPTAVAGMSVCLMDSGTAHDLILDVQEADTMTFKGTEGSAGVGITNASGSSTGDFVCVVAIAAGKWATMGMQGTWASQ